MQCSKVNVAKFSRHSFWWETYHRRCTWTLLGGVIRLQLELVTRNHSRTHSTVDVTFPCLRFLFLNFLIADSVDPVSPIYCAEMPAHGWPRTRWREGLARGLTYLEARLCVAYDTRYHYWLHNVVGTTVSMCMYIDNDFLRQTSSRYWQWRSDCSRFVWRRTNGILNIVLYV